MNAPNAMPAERPTYLSDDATWSIARGAQRDGARVVPHVSIMSSTHALSSLHPTGGQSLVKFQVPFAHFRIRLYASSTFPLHSSGCWQSKGMHDFQLNMQVLLRSPCGAGMPVVDAHGDICSGGAEKNTPNMQWPWLGSCAGTM
jgi:hypothetical protein